MPKWLRDKIAYEKKLEAQKLEDAASDGLGNSQKGSVVTKEDTPQDVDQDMENDSMAKSGFKSMNSKQLATDKIMNQTGEIKSKTSKEDMID